MVNCFFVGLGGFLGASARYMMGKLPFAEIQGLPAGTFLINVLGAFLIGLIVSATNFEIIGDKRLVLFLKTGLCGGFTTFSTFSLETLGLIQEGRPVAACGYAVLSLVICLLAVWAGCLAGKKCFG